MTKVSVLVVEDEPAQRTEANKNLKKIFTDFNKYLLNEKSTDSIELVVIRESDLIFQFAEALAYLKGCFEVAVKNPLPDLILLDLRNRTSDSVGDGQGFIEKLFENLTNNQRKEVACRTAFFSSDAGTRINTFRKSLIEKYEEINEISTVSKTLDLQNHYNRSAFSKILFNNTAISTLRVHFEKCFYNAEKPNFDFVWEEKNKFKFKLSEIRYIESYTPLLSRNKRLVHILNISKPTEVMGDLGATIKIDIFKGFSKELWNNNITNTELEICLGTVTDIPIFCRFNKYIMNLIFVKEFKVEDNELFAIMNDDTKLKLKYKMVKDFTIIVNSLNTYKEKVVALFFDTYSL